MTETAKKKRRIRSKVMFKITVERLDPIFYVGGNLSAEQLQSFEKPGQELARLDPYTPQIRSVVILEQILPEAKFDMAKLVRAINGL